jgi:hypothetical protein
VLTTVYSELVLFEHLVDLSNKSCHIDIYVN